MRERPNRMVSKTIVAQVTVGSNPTPSATNRRSEAAILLDPASDLRQIPSWQGLWHGNGMEPGVQSGDPGTQRPRRVSQLPVGRLRRARRPGPRRVRAPNADGRVTPRGDEGPRATFDRCRARPHRTVAIAHGVGTRRSSGGTRRARDLSPSTRIGYRYWLDNRVLPEFGKKRISAVTTADVERWYGTTPRRRSAARDPFDPRLSHRPVGDVHGCSAVGIPAGFTGRASTAAEGTEVDAACAGT